MLFELNDLLILDIIVLQSSISEIYDSPKPCIFTFGSYKHNEF